MSQMGPGTGLSLTAMQAVRLQSSRLTAYRQETQVATVTDTFGDTVDAVTVADQVCIARQDIVTEGTYHIPVDPASTGPPRRGHSVTYFQVGRDCYADIGELQLATEYTASDGVNSIWLAIYESNDALFAVNRRLVGTLGFRHSDRLERSVYSLVTFIAAQESIALHAGHHYWLAICAGEPEASPLVRWCPDPLAPNMPRAWAKKQSGVVGVLLLINNNDGAAGVDHAYPDLTSTYDSYLTEHPWYRLYERKHTLQNVLLSAGASPPSIGDLTLIRRNAGLHSQPEVLGPLTGQTAGGIGRVTSAAPSPGVGASANAPYVTMALDASLNAERVLTGTANQVIVTDGGAGSTVTLSTPQNIHTGASPTFVNETLTGLTASRLMASDGAKAHTSVGALSAWIAGTANRVTVADDGDGSVTLSGPQDIDTAAGPTFNHIHLSALTAGRVPYVGAGAELVDNAGLTWSTAAGLISTIWKATPLNALRTTDVTTGRGASLLARYTTSAEMIDGFGPAIYFQAVDATSGVLDYGDFGYFRDGADNTAKFSLRILQGGVSQERLTLDAAGNLVIGGTITANGGIFTGLTPGSVLFAGAGGALAQDNANLFWDDALNRLGIGNAAPAYPLDVTGAVRMTSVLGVGTTPTSAYAVLASITAVADVTTVGGGFTAIGNVAGGFANQMFGALFAAQAATNATNAGYGLIGLRGATFINADDVTVTRGVGVLAQIRAAAAAAGHPRTYTAADCFRAETSIGANSILTTLRGFYMPTCSGTTRWGVYIEDTGANSYFASQVQLAVGAVGAPGQAWIGDLTTGRYHPGASTDAVTIAGTERFRVMATGVAIAAADKFFLDGVTGAGNTYILESSGDVIGFVANANQQFEVRPTKVWLDNTNTALTTDGDMTFGTTARALIHRYGDADHYNGPNLACGPTSADQLSGPGPMAETAFATTFTIPAAWWAAGKGVEINAVVTARCSPTDIGLSLTTRVRFADIAGQILAVSVVGAGVAEGEQKGIAIFRILLMPRTRAAGATIVFGGLSWDQKALTASLPSNLALNAARTYLENSPNTFVGNTTVNRTIYVTLQATAGGGGVSWDADLNILHVRAMM